MEKFSAVRYCDLVAGMARLDGSLAKLDQTSSLLEKPGVKDVMLNLHNVVRKQCEAIGLTISSKCAGEMIRKIQNEKPTAGEWIPLLVQLEKTIRWELEDRLGLSPGVRQTVKTLFAVRWNCIVLRRRLLAKCAPAGEAEAGSAGVQPAKE